MPLKASCCRSLLPFPLLTSVLPSTGFPSSTPVLQGLAVVDAGSSSSSATGSISGLLRGGTSGAGTTGGGGYVINTTDWVSAKLQVQVHVHVVRERVQVRIVRVRCACGLVGAWVSSSMVRLRAGASH
jgi:hypothetical protein